MRTRPVLVLILSAIFGSCQYLPFWPLNDRQQEEGPDVIHLATNFYGVLVPSTGQMYGCVWTIPINGWRMERCRGLWKYDPSSDSMTPIVDTLTSPLEIYTMTLSSDEQYILIQADYGVRSSMRLMLFDIPEERVVSSIPETTLNLVGPILPSWENPVVGYMNAWDCFGDCGIAARINFLTGEISAAESLIGWQGFYVIPSSGGKDSVVVVDSTYASIPSNPKLHLLYGCGFMDYQSGKVYTYSSELRRKIPEMGWEWWPWSGWVGTRDSFLFYAKIHTSSGKPKRLEVWLIRNLSRYLVETSEGCNSNKKAFQVSQEVFP